MKREVGVLENLYSGTFKRLATSCPSLLSKSPCVTSYVTHKTKKKSAIVKDWKHICLPFQCNVKVYSTL